MSVQADLSLLWVHMSEGMFSHVVANLLPPNLTFYEKTKNKKQKKIKIEPN